MNVFKLSRKDILDHTILEFDSSNLELFRLSNNESLSSKKIDPNKLNSYSN